MAIMKITSKDELIRYIKKNKPIFKKEYGVTRIGLFGSFVQGKANPSSDIDIVIEMDREKKNLHNFMQLRRLLEQQTERKIDLGFENSLKPIVRKSLKNQIIYV